MNLFVHQSLTHSQIPYIIQKKDNLGLCTIRVIFIFIYGSALDPNKLSNFLFHFTPAHLYLGYHLPILWLDMREIIRYLFHSAIEGIKSDDLQLQENHYVHPGAEGVPSHLQTKGI